MRKRQNAMVSVGKYVLPDTTTTAVVQRIPVTIGVASNDIFVVVSNFEFSISDVSSPLAFTAFASPYYSNIYVPTCASFGYG